MWEWFTTKPFVDAGRVRFVRHATLVLTSARLRLPFGPRPYVHVRHTVITRSTLYCTYMTFWIGNCETAVDRLSTHALAVVVNCRSSIARPRAVPRVARFPGSPLDVCRRIRCAREPGWAER